MAVLIRTGLSVDLDAVAELWATNAGPTRLASGRAEAQVLLRRDPEALIVAERQNVIVGTVIIGWDGWRCHLYRMAIAESCRRQGIGQRLVDEARNRAKALGASRIDAMVADTNQRAIAFWESLGFDLDTDDRRWSVLL